MRDRITQAKATDLRGRATDAERRLWSRLRLKQLDGFKFRRQVPIGPYIADFACLAARIVVELNGGQHAGSDTDRTRDQFLVAEGFRVLRFWNPDVMSNMQGVLEEIRGALLAAPIPAFPRKRGKENGT